MSIIGTRPPLISETSVGGWLSHLWRKAASGETGLVGKHTIGGNAITAKFMNLCKVHSFRKL